MSLTIFLSTVTTEFPGYRAKLRAELVGVQVEVKDQEYFKNYGVTTLAKLDLYVSESDYVVHLVGDMPGALPPATSVEALAAKYKDRIDRLPPLREALTAGVSLSYTQWEAWLVLIHDKRLIITEATPAAPRRPGHKADDALQSAQRAHVERLKRLGHWPSPVDDVGDLAKLVLHLLLGGRRLSAREPGRLSGPRDNRLEPREGKVYGRTDEVARVLAFLRGTDTATVVSAHITGVGGIGKTEVCKAALKDWLTERPDAVVYYVDVPDRATADELIYRVARSLGRDAIDSLDRLLLEMPDGLYYLDNLESVAEAPRGIETLRALKARAGVRVLASCRVDLAGLFGTPIDVGGLPVGEAIRLFRDLWNGSDALPDRGELSPFIVQQLGCHALSVTLTARLGSTYSFPELVRQWKRTGASMAQSMIDQSRLGSVPVSLRLSAEALASHPGTLALWTAVALFATGIPGDLLGELEEVGGWAEARPWLVGHHLLVRQGDRWQVLPPVGRYALDMSRASQDGFDWAHCRESLQRVFEALARQADSIASTTESLKGRARFLEHFGTWARFVSEDLASVAPDLDWLQAMLDRTRNTYQFRAPVGREVLGEMSSGLRRPALAMRLLGDLESRLGRVDEARQLYDRALALFEGEQDGLGQANTLQALGVLESRLGRVDEARQLYDRALALFEGEQDGLGQANTLRALGDLESRLGRVDEARQLYDRALALFEGEQAGLGQANTFQALGDLESRLGRVDEARQLYDRALALFEGEQDGLGQARTLKGLGDLESRLGRVDEARQLYDRALALFEGEQDGLGQANTLQALGILESRLGWVDEARQLYDRALALFEGEQAGLGQANTLQALGVLESRLGRVDEARQLYDRALALFEGEQDGLGQAYTLKALGDLESRLGRVDEARQLYDRALALFEGEQDGLGQANTLRALGDLESRLGRVDEARQLYDRALALFEGEQVGLGQASTLKGLGDLESRLGRVDEARQLYDRALALFEGEQDGLGQANTLQALGDLESRLGRVDEARQLYDRALALFEGEQVGLGQASTLKGLGDLESRLGRVDEARQLYDRALTLFEGEQAGLGQANTLQALGVLESRLGRVDEARQLYDRALALFEGEQTGLGQAYTLKALGDLESRLGRVDEARQLYDRALALFEGEQDGLGQANTLRALGDLESRLGRVDEARQLYDRALALFEGEQVGLGQASTLKGLGDLERKSGQVETAATHYESALKLYHRQQEPMGTAYTLAELARCRQSQGELKARDDALRRALAAARQAGTESVVQYVSMVLVEVTGGRDAADAWLEAANSAAVPSGLPRRHAESRWARISNILQMAFGRRSRRRK